MNNLSDYELEDFNGILMIRLQDPKTIRHWIHQVARDDDFHELIMKSPDEQTGAVLAGSSSKPEFKLTITYSFRVEVLAGKIIEGSAILLFPNGEEQRHKADKIMMTLVTLVSELFKS